MSAGGVLFGLAGGVAVVWLLVHIFAGGKDVVRPLLGEAGLDPVVRDTLHVCWHFVSVAIALMAALYFLAVFSSREEFAMAGTALAAGFATVGIGLVARLGARFRDIPQGFLFLPVAVLGAAGLLV